MECSLFIPYDYVDCETFDQSDIYNTEGSYEEALKRELEAGNSVFDALFGNSSIEDLKPLERTEIVNKTKSEKYVRGNIKLIKANMEVETIDNLITYAVNGKPCVLWLVFDYDNMDDEFGTDFHLWLNTHENIRKVNMDEDWKCKNEPTRNYVMSCKNKQNEDVFLTLENCKLLAEQKQGAWLTKEKCYTVLVGKISFSEPIEYKEK